MSGGVGAGLYEFNPYGRTIFKEKLNGFTVLEGRGPPWLLSSDIIKLKKLMRAPRQRHASKEPRVPMKWTGRRWLPITLLIACLFAIYSRVFTFGFVNYDDPDYILNNPLVTAGLTMHGLASAFTQSYAANWHPLTWISHMIDFQLFGTDAGMHHLTSVVLHAVSTLILFVLLWQLTGFLYRSLFVAFGFAFHPLHVESVAWISERKDVLCALFFFLTLWAYVVYARISRPIRYVWVLLLFVCALLSKQMAVTLPIILILLDYWPLKRPVQVIEKLPLFALSIGAGLIAFFSQRSAGALIPLPLSAQLMNIPVAYVTYLYQFLFPHRLAVFYPFDTSLRWEPWAATGVLLMISVIAWRQRSRRPYLLAGWLWYLITLLPVIGIIQIGAQGHADRYTYIPLVGILIAVGWAIAETGKPAIYIGGAAALLWAGLSVIQIGYWSDSVTLFTHAIEVTRANYLAYNNLGEALSKSSDKLADAIASFEQSVEAQPAFAKAHYNLGTALLESGRKADGIRELEIAIRLNPGYSAARNNLGKALATNAESRSEAIKQYLDSVAADPNRGEAHLNLANALAQEGKSNEAISEYKAALKINANLALAHFGLANVLSSITSRLAEAVQEYREAIRLQPNMAVVQNNLGSTLAKMPGKVPEATAAFRVALKLDPSYAEAHFNLGNVLAQTPGGMPDAIAEWQDCVRINPRHVQAHYNIGVAMAQSSHFREAIQEFETSDRIHPDPKIEAIIEQLRGQ